MKRTLLKTGLKAGKRVWMAIRYIVLAFIGLLCPSLGPDYQQENRPED